MLHCSYVPISNTVNQLLGTQRNNLGGRKDHACIRFHTYLHKRVLISELFKIMWNYFKGSFVLYVGLTVSLTKLKRYLFAEQQGC